MKGFFKLTTAALALVAMASCSNDDFLTNGQAAADGQAEGALQVEVENLIDGVTTRAAYVADGTSNKLFWQDKDQIWVLDETMLQKDEYEFSWKRSTFENNKKDVVKTPAFAFTTDRDDMLPFPFVQLSSKVWDTDKDQVIITYNLLGNAAGGEAPYQIANSGVDNEIASTKGNPVKAYNFSLPMWGTAQKTDAGVSVNMKYLTSVLRVDMAQLPSNWGMIMITGWKDQAATIEAPLTGSFKAVISDEDEIDENAQLVELTPYDQTAQGLAALGLGTFVANDNAIFVGLGDWDSEELAWLRANGGHVYIPLIAQKYGTIQFWYYDTKTTSWKLYKKTKPFEAKRGTVYRMNIEEFEIAGSDAESLNVLLEQKKDATGAVTVKTTYPTEMQTGKNVIKIPAGFKGNPLTLDLQGIDGPAAFELESEDGKYEGDVVIDLSDASFASGNPIYLNLPNSNVTLKGDFSGSDLGGTAPQNELIVKSLTIAPISDDDVDKGFAATNVGDIYPNYESFSTGEGIEVQKGTTVGDIDMTGVNENNDKFIAKSKIVIKGTAGDIFANNKNPLYSADKKEYYQEVPVTVEGGTTGDINTASPITLTDATVVDVTSIWSDVTASGTTSANSLEATNENVIMSGKATSVDVAAPKVELSEEANVTNEAKATTLSIVGTAWVNDATMNADGTATINLSAEGEAIKGNFTVDNTAITLTQGYIKNITGATGATAALTFGEGEGFTAIGGISTATVVFKNASTWNGKKIGDTFKTAGYVGPYPITACQLASWDFSSATTLINDIDLNNQAWTPVELKVDIDGSEKTIKNLAVTAAANDAGLFSKITSTGTITIQNLTIDGAAVAATGKENVGVLAGSATADLTINKVVVKNATVEGKYYLGGFVGNAKGATVDDDSNANGVTFTVNNPNNKPQISDASDAKAGSVGQFFGAVDGAVVVPAFTSAIDPATMGFKANFEVLTGNVAYCYYGGTRAAGLFATGSTIKVAGTAMVDAIGAKLDAKSTTNEFGYRLKLAAW